MRGSHSTASISMIRSAKRSLISKIMHVCNSTCHIRLNRRDASRAIKFWSKVIVFVSALAFVAFYIAPAGLHQYVGKLASSVHQEYISGYFGNKTLCARERTPYKRRSNMGPCEAKFGTVTVFIGLLKNALEGEKYIVAQNSLKCYLKGVNYRFVTVNLEDDERTRQLCYKYNNFLFKRHCIASEYLKDTDWMLILDADTGVVNPNHCIEEWIDDRVHVILYERFFSFEISAASFMVRNSEIGRNFLMQWADMEFTLQQNYHGLDNGVLHLLVLQTVLPDAQQAKRNCYDVWRNAKTFENYMGFVSCVKQALGATRLWPGKLRLYRKAHGWVRDGFLTAAKWHDGDFMFHGWKGNNVTEDAWGSPFSELPDLNLCGHGTDGWHWNKHLHVDADNIRKDLADFERSAGETFSSHGKQVFSLTMPDIGQCYPDCEMFT